MADPVYEEIEHRLAAQPPITFPTITIEGDADGVTGPPRAAPPAARFPSLVDHRIFEGIGHNVPQEAPKLFAQAVLDLKR